MSYYGSSGGDSSSADKKFRGELEKLRSNFHERVLLSLLTISRSRGLLSSTTTLAARAKNNCLLNDRKGAVRHGKRVKALPLDLETHANSSLHHFSPYCS
jgi:hypothetical protein